jgi:membrane protein YqaA with SNARE-associated domain
MNFELRRINARKAANVFAAVYGLLMLVMSLIAIPMFMFAPNVDVHGGPVSKSMFLLMLLLYPVFGAIAGWLAGYLLGSIYNLAAKRFGGLEFEGVRLPDGN